MNESAPEMPKYPSEVAPMLQLMPQVRQVLHSHNTAILQAPPGTGKSTVLPIELLQESWLGQQKILMLEPRKLAARAVASRMASLLGEEVGQTVGYRVRFDNKTSSQTRLEVLTEGILTRMLQSDPELQGIGLIIFDEFHERNLQADLALALCREAQQVLREDLRLLVMSATMDAQQLSAMLGNAPILHTEARQHPVELRYLGYDVQAKLEIQMAKAIRQALRENEGDILAFLPGTAEIRRTQAQLEEQPLEGVAIMPLYGDLPLQAQQQAIMPHPQGMRKVVLATTIAETSLTIEGVRVVIDAGLSRQSQFDVRSGLTRLETVKVTQDAAQQRAGRAGRLGPGVCYRLWEERAHHYLQAHRTPEILVADLAPTVLELANWGNTDPTALAWLTPPPSASMQQAYSLLEDLEAIENQQITSTGKALLRLPTHPRLAHLLLAGERLGYAWLAADIAALLEERDPVGNGVDLSTRLDALWRFRRKQPVQADKNLLDRIDRLSQTWRRFFKEKPSNEDAPLGKVGELLATAFPERVAKRTDQAGGRYKLANGRMAKMPEHDLLAMEEWIAIAHLDGQAQEGRIFLAAPLLANALSERLTATEVVAWDAQKGILLARTEWRVGQVISHTAPLANVSEEAKVQALCQAVQKEGLKLLDWTEDVLQWQARVMSLRHWQGEDWPDVGNEWLLAHVEEWLAPFLGQVRKREDFSKLRLSEILPTLLSWQQQQELDRLAPVKIPVPSGSQIALEYRPDGEQPILAVRLQEMFGLLDTPTVNQGKMAVLLHLLSPGYKPVQVTQDLRSFWQNTYPEVRKELRMRYPKHSWPEDPWTAEAVRGVKRRQ